MIGKHFSIMGVTKHRNSGLGMTSGSVTDL